MRYFRGTPSSPVWLQCQELSGSGKHRARKAGSDTVTKSLRCWANTFGFCHIRKTPCSQWPCWVVGTLLWLSNPPVSRSPSIGFRNLVRGRTGRGRPTSELNVTSSFFLFTLLPHLVSYQGLWLICHKFSLCFFLKQQFSKYYLLGSGTEFRALYMWSIHHLIQSSE